MKIGFFGTPDFAAFFLTRLIEKYTIAFIVTAEDKPSGRHRNVHFSPVKEIAVGEGIPLYQPSMLGDQAFIDAISSAGADLFVVVAYGKIIPSEVFTLPPLKTINLHPSLLPKYRGAAPIQWAIICGDQETGITVQLMNEKLDAGDILSQKEIPIDRDVTAGELSRIMMNRGAEFLIDTIDQMARNHITPVKQNEEEATYCDKLDKELARINWNTKAGQIHNLVRGLNPSPVAWTTFRDTTIRIWRTAIIEEEIPVSGAHGYLTAYQKKRLIVETGDGPLEILELQPETRKVMDARSFINGYRLKEGDFFQ